METKKQYDERMSQRKSLPKTALPRIYFIDQYIASGRYPNGPQMAEKLKTSLASINRDISFMRDMMGAPIEYDFFKKGYYYTEKTFRLPAAHVGVNDILALSMAKGLVDLYRDTPIYESAMNLLENISAPLQVDVVKAEIPLTGYDSHILDIHTAPGQNAGWLENRIVVPKSTAKPVDKKTWDCIVSGLRENRIISFQYESIQPVMGRLHPIPAETRGHRVPKPYRNAREKDRKPALPRRRICPYQLLFDRDVWYLIGRGEDGKFRKYSLLRISAISLEPETFTIDKKYNFRRLKDLYYFDNYGGKEKYKFVISFLGSPERVTDGHWAKNQQILETKTGIQLSFTSTDLGKVLRWLLRFGPGARPVAPAKLVKQWKDATKEMAELADSKPPDIVIDDRLIFVFQCERPGDKKIKRVAVKAASFNEAKAKLLYNRYTIKAFLGIGA